MSNATMGNRLRQLRGNTPRRDVANAVGISVSALQMYENGSRVPRDEAKKRIAEYFGTTVQAIFFDEDSTNRAETIKT